MTRRALTLIEMLIVLALLAALAGVALAITLPMLGARAFDRATDVSVHQLLIARAHARETRGSIEIIRHAEPSRLVARRFDPERTDERDTDAREDVIDEGWAVVLLPERVVVTRAQPGPDEELERAKEDATSDVERLVVFLPDGSVLDGGTFWLADDAGRVARIDVHPWTGTPTIERITAEALVKDREDEPEDEEEPADRAPDEDPPSEDSEPASEPAESNEPAEPAEPDSDDEATP